jgi:hypothetical protein
LVLNSLFIYRREIVARNDRIVDKTGLPTFGRRDIDQHMGFVAHPRQIRGDLGHNGVVNLLIVHVILDYNTRAATRTGARRNWIKCQHDVASPVFHFLKSS